jgi:hypothetical protein
MRGFGAPLATAWSWFAAVGWAFVLELQGEWSSRARARDWRLKKGAKRDIPTTRLCRLNSSGSPLGRVSDERRGQGTRRRIGSSTSFTIWLHLDDWDGFLLIFCPVYAMHYGHRIQNLRGCMQGSRMVSPTLMCFLHVHHGRLIRIAACKLLTFLRFSTRESCACFNCTTCSVSLLFRQHTRITRILVPAMWWVHGFPSASTFIESVLGTASEICPC